jgi:hypothetical protein
MVTAIFDRSSDAEEAVSRLEAAGIPRDSICLVSGNERDTHRDAMGSPDTISLGDAGVSFWDTLRDLFRPDVDRHTTAEGLRRGGYLVSVSATDAEYERVRDILDDKGTIDIDERAESWHAKGLKGSSTRDVLSGPTADLTIGASSGAPLSAGSGLGAASMNPSPDRKSRGDDAFQDRTIEMDERSEVAVITKEARIKEQLVVKKDVEQRTKSISDTIHSTEVEVEDERGSKAGGTGTHDRVP